MESNAKEDMGQALKQLARKKPFDKIAVSDITAFSGYNRQTFYYHFQDKYELLNWVYYQDIFADLVKGIDFDNWDGHLCRMLEKMKEESYFYQNTIRYAQDSFQEHLYHVTTELFTEAIEALDTREKISKPDKKFYAGFFAHGACGIVIDWMKRGMKEEPRVFVKFMKGLVLSSEKAAYERYSSEPAATKTD